MLRRVLLHLFQFSPTQEWEERVREKNICEYFSKLLSARFFLIIVVLSIRPYAIGFKCFPHFDDDRFLLNFVCWSFRHRTTSWLYKFRISSEMSSQIKCFKGRWWFDAKKCCVKSPSSFPPRVKSLANLVPSPQLRTLRTHSATIAPWRGMRIAKICLTI